MLRISVEMLVFNLCQNPEEVGSSIRNEMPQQWDR